MSFSPLRLVGLAVVAAACVSVSACLDAGGTPEIVVGVAAGQPDQAVLGELIARQLAGRDAATVRVDAVEAAGGEDMIDHLSAGTIDVAVICTGETLAQLNPQAASTAAANLHNSVAAENRPGPVELTYDATLASLPGGIGVTDSVGGEGCRSADGPLPNNVLPVFRSSRIDRDLWWSLDLLAERLDTVTLQKLSAAVDAGASPAQVADEFYRAALVDEAFEEQAREFAEHPRWL
ncbi:type 2 periplasmic-binding domain-containing protein [Corynebacterium uterequi]|nr:hypothetical protein [Corynebacterium uterequi]